MFFAQGEIVEAVPQIFEGRDSNTVVILVALAAVIGLVWLVFKRDAQDRKEEREERQKQRDIENARAEREENQRRETNEKFASSIALAAEQNGRMADAVEKFADAMERNEEWHRKNDGRHERDRRAIVSAIDSLEARSQGDQSRADEALRRARQIITDN